MPTVPPDLPPSSLTCRLPLQDLEGQLSDCRAAAADATDQITDLRYALEDAQSAGQDKDDRIADLVEQLATARTQLAEAQAAAATDAADSTAAQAAAGEAQTERDGLLVDLAACQAEVAAPTCPAELADTQAQLEAALQDAALVAPLQAQLKRAKAQLAIAAGEVKGLVAAKGELQQQLDLRDGDTYRCNTNIEAVQLKLQSCKAALTAANSKAAAAVSKLGVCEEARDGCLEDLGYAQTENGEWRSGGRASHGCSAGLAATVCWTAWRALEKKWRVTLLVVGNPDGHWWPLAAVRKQRAKQ
jgi:chromosome segregation ATPase